MAKSIIRQRRERGAICGVCRSPDYTMYPPVKSWGQTKPYFICNQCGHEWTYGLCGGMFSELRLKVGENND